MKMLENDPACVTCITEVFHMHRFIENVLNTLVTFVIFSLEARLQQTTSTLNLTFRPCYFVTLEYVGLAPARSVLYSKFQCVHVNLLLLPLLMRCVNKSGNRHTYNRHCLEESIEVTRGNTATHPPNYFINDQPRQPSLRPDLTPTFPPTGST